MSECVGLGLECSQCSTDASPACISAPPSATPCPSSARYCLILKEYQPSLTGVFKVSCSKIIVACQDDADAVLAEERVGELLFLARTCVTETVGDTCGEGSKQGRAVTVCRYSLHGQNFVSSYVCAGSTVHRTGVTRQSPGPGQSSVLSSPASQSCSDSPQFSVY